MEEDKYYARFYRTIRKRLLPVAEADQAGVLYPAMRALRVFFVMLAKTRVIDKLDHLHIHFPY